MKPEQREERSGCEGGKGLDLLAVILYQRSRENVMPFVLSILSYLVHVIILYLYSASILYYWHLPLTGHLPKITEILILSGFTLSISLHFILTILGQTFSWLIAFVPIDSPWLPSILLHLCITQLWSDSTHLCCSRCVTLLRTFWCILQIMMHLLSVVWLVLCTCI